MYNFHPTNEFATAPPAHAEDNPCARLNWLSHWNAETERRALRFRDAREEEQMLSMRRPMAAREAFSIFGLMLGAFVPAAIFYRFVNYGVHTEGSGFGQLLYPALFCAMNIVCCVVGYRMSALFAESIELFERKSWSCMLAYAACAGACWGLVTGAAGGALFFIIGALFGAFIAFPVGVAGFVSFALLHRLMARGGMIDARHLWPLACGVVLTITALILSPYL